jgi:4-amino-4-deoxy-L-arabinose transferase-like glycosyltransferase
MPSDESTTQGWIGRWGAEALLAVVAGLAFLGCLGSVDLWGKREQRAAAEAIDTIRHQHWLVAQIQSRPRLEKPPLPRWTIATLMTLTGRHDEWIVRLPSALAAIGMVGLVYGLGRRLGGRSVGLASGMVLATMVFFITEQRQAGNDGPLAFFTTLALYAAWRRLHGGAVEGEVSEPGIERGAWGWLLVFYAALGLGFLTKGPIVLLLAALTLLPYLAIRRRLKPGLAALGSLTGLALFVILALSWPVPVMLSDPNAVKVWLLEMGQKAGTAGIRHPHDREILAANWPWMTAPWTILATWAVLLPLVMRKRGGYPPVLWYAWCWAIVNLAMFCLWNVAKPNYFLPCLPAAALLAGHEWVRLARAAHEVGAAGTRARRVLQTHWVVFFVAAVVAPVVAGQRWPEVLAPMLGISTAVVAGVVVSAWRWRRGGASSALAPLVGGLAVSVVIVYGAISPIGNAAKSHRGLAATLDLVLPDDARTVMFFHELDEGLWFYLGDRELAPVPGSNPKYNDGLTLVEDFKNKTLIYDPAERMRRERQFLVDWITEEPHESPYLLLKSKKYAAYALELAPLTTLIYREGPMNRNEITLLKINAPPAVARGAWKRAATR